jgi:hypothetical protein
MDACHRRSRCALAAAAALLAANVVVPLVWGDLYPFTSGPMFRDRPAQCCNYRVYDPAGRELPLAEWFVQRIYDGNPVGYGVGIHPPAVIEQEFGIVHDEAAVRRHIERQLQAHSRAYDYVDVVQEIVGPIDDQHVGVVCTNRWRINRSKPTP